MLIAFWVIVALVGVLLFTNVSQVVAQYRLDADKARVLVYLAPLLLVGYLVVHVTFRVMDFAHAAEDQEGSGEIVPMHRAVFKKLPPPPDNP